MKIFQQTASKKNDNKKSDLVFDFTVCACDMEMSRKRNDKIF